MVVMKPFSIPKLSTLARGTTELVAGGAETDVVARRVVLVVVDAHDDGDVLVLAGAEMMIFHRALRCWAASSRLVKMPDSMTTSTPRSPQGSWDGSRWALARTRWPPMVIDSSSKDTSSPSRPKVESYLSRWARVLLSVRSFTATTSTSVPLAAR